MRPAYVHTAQVRLAPGTEPAAPGGAVTVALCGHRGHAGAGCRWPHHTSVAASADGSGAEGPDAEGLHAVRVLFACEAAQEPDVRARVAAALDAGIVDGPAGPQAWAVVSQAPGAVRADERSLAERLSGTPWWTSAVVYQVYPRSFADSDGDGIGDLPGITAHLDHLAWLGIDAVWLSPVYSSPQHDNGYDISDYEDVDPTFGTLADLDALIAGCHARGIRLVMDLVVNHTSDQHPWFVASRSSTQDPKRDWYWWRPARAGRQPGTPGAEPTNWGSAFSGPAWHHDEATGEYFLHLFARQQPDLNWENPQVRQALYAMMRRWLDRGVDGFRMDVVNFISKAVGPDGALPDGRVPPGSRVGDGRPHYVCGPRVHEFLAEMHREVFADRPGRLLTVGEMPGVTVDEARLFTDPARAEVDMVFQFEHVELDRGASKWDALPFDLLALKASFGRWQTGLAETGWNSLYWDNHDQPRAVSRFGDDGEHRVAAAKMLATVLHLHRGTPFVYQGEEIGMTNAPFPAVTDFRDVESVNHYRDAVEVGGQDPEVVLAALRPASRDNARTPMQWDAGPGAGFTTGTPWIGVNPNADVVNVEAARVDPTSVLHHHRALVRLRHDEPTVALGDFTMLLADDPDVYAFTRRLGRTELLVLGNFGATPRDVVVPDVPVWAAAEVVAGDPPADGPGGCPGSALRLGPWEGRAYRRRTADPAGLRPTRAGAGPGAAEG